MVCQFGFAAAINMHFSVFTLLSQALRGNTGWTVHWRDAEPKSSYDVIIAGGGGHGLATAYYLAKEHGITNTAVLEKSLIGSGNAGRNTTIIRSNYLLPGNIPFYEWSMKLWERLEHDINYNAMVSQRGVLNLYHSDGQRDAYVRRGNAMRLHGVDAELLETLVVSTWNTGTPARRHARIEPRNRGRGCVRSSAW
jgi:methylglutamate dehydrogenase subunit A